MTEQKPKRYFRITRAERSSIERALRRRSRSPGPWRRTWAARPPPSPGSEAQPGGGQRAGKERGRQGARGRMRETAALALGVQRVQAVALPLLKWRCEYSAARAQALSELTRAISWKRQRPRVRLQAAMSKIRTDIGSQLSPAQIANGRKDELDVSPSTIAGSQRAMGACQRRAAAQSGIQAPQEAQGAGSPPWGGALLRGVLCALQRRAGQRLRDGHRDRQGRATPNAY